MGWGVRRKSRSSAENYENSARWLPAGFSNPHLLIVGLLLSAFGTLMIYSSSAVLGLQKYGDSLYFVKKHGVFLLVGWLLYFLIAQLPLVRMGRFRVHAFIGSILLLLVVFVPGFGFTAGGAQRWVNLGVFGFQPSELVRLLFIFYVAATLALRQDRLSEFNRGFLPLLVSTGLVMFCLMLQPDFGGAMTIFLLSLSLWFIGGVPLSYLAGLFILSLPGVILLMVNAAYRAKRVMTFLDPWADMQGSGFQVIQSFVAFYQGGWSGVGIGNSQQKLFYLPAAHTDFIFSVLGEELGVIGVIGVVLLFLLLLRLGTRVARSQLSLFGYFLATGSTLYLVVPALLNMLVTMGLLPTKGLTLPFFSSGGSSLLVSLMALGVLQSLHSRKQKILR